MAGFRWTDKTEEAAKDVALDRLTNQEIAEKAGVTRQALDKWKLNPEFKARVDAHHEEFKAIVRRRGIAQLERRVDALNTRWDLMHRVIAERAADPGMQLPAGGKTGLMVHTVKGVGKGDDFQLIDLYEVDVGLLREMREHEKQAAQELGQWTEKKEVTGQDGGPIDIDLGLGGLSNDELRNLIAIGGKLAAGAGSED
jgi:hypothetical protein